jgi:hypothetical protein
MVKPRRSGKQPILVAVRPKKKKEAAASSKPQQVTLLGQALRSLGGLGGGAIGSMFGAPVTGSAVGTSLGTATSKWLGSGDYAVGSNSVVRSSLKAASSIPAMHADGQSIVVRHKEYLGEVISSTSFTVQQSFPLNPGLSTTFPWLAGIAVRFQEYRIKGMVFHYIPTSGSAVSSTNAALGSVMLQTSYRSTDAAPGSKVELLNEYCSNEAVPCEPFAHPIECDPKENPFNVQYVRSGPVTSGETQLMYDLGQTHLAVTGCQTDGNVLGDLWVTYEVELKKPIVASNVTSAVASCSNWFGAGLSPTTIFGPNTNVAPGSLAVTTLNNTLTFPKGAVGKYQVWIALQGSAVTMTVPTVTGTKATLIKPVAGQPWTLWHAVTTSTSNSFLFAIEIVDPAVNPVITVTFPGSPVWTGPTSTYYTITEIA